ncbi:MAG: DUF1552 domain-containing protein [Verrucomicrobiales bacterium]|nr:DUF1552 domain-containing protein [Verrucomicrobiales bacterium]MCP5526528.1 DUF1552 domain-containing protein [Verrucomicrobiales bacterium]
MKHWRIPRRTFLKGAGATLGLPILEAMGEVLNGASATAAATTTSERTVRPPVRLACLFYPNGVWEDTWYPKTAGAAFDLPFAMEPLAPHRDRLLVFSGLDKANSRSGDGHYAKTANFLTGLPVRKTTGKDLSVGGLSIDQLCAREIGHLTPLPSLELGIDPVISGIDTNVGYTRLYGSYISWRSPSVPVAREINPQLAYERLFGVFRAARQPTRDDRSQAGDQQALLDLVLEDARRLRTRLGRDDQFKLDEYMDAVRDVEKRIAFFARQDRREWGPGGLPAADDLAAPTGAPGDHQEHVRLMLDLIVLAFRTDATRISTFMFANDVSGKNFSALIPGVNGGHHELSHHQNEPAKCEGYSKINRWHSEQLAYLCDRMAAIREGERTLLDNSLLLFGSSLSDGNRHDPNNLPILLAGGGGGSIKPGRHIASPKNTPLCNLYVSLLERMGTPVDAFGDSTEALPLS